MWKDLFYFSKSDRRAIAFFVLVIAVSTVLRVNLPRRGPSQGHESGLPADSVAWPAAGAMRQSAAGHGEPVNEAERADARADLRQSTSGVARQAAGDEASRGRSGGTGQVYRRRVKYPPGTVLDLNAADTAQLVMVPGIGSYFARRIVGYRERLGGYCSTAQLLEIEGLPDSVTGWFQVADTFRVRSIPVNRSTLDELRGHPYISYRMARAMVDFRRREGAIRGPAQLALLEEFDARDLQRVTPYLDFGD